MTRNAIHITSTDAEKLRELLAEAARSGYRGSPYLQDLAAELERAVIVAPGALPADVIAMNTTAVLTDLAEGDTLTYTLVFPEDADLANGKISVLAPIGTAMLGYRVGDTFSWKTPAGEVRLRVERIN